ncbi:MAG: hypothetical protein M1426_04635 [Patescibacteria group bacterium]|nr:hypothetical protein [Patescibacteria group bacterium]
MILIKKIAFGLLFLTLAVELFYLSAPFFKTTDLIFSLDLQTAYQLLILSLLILVSALVFTIFAALSLNWKLVLPVIVISSLAPFVFTSFPLSLSLGTGMAISLLLSYLGLEGKMKSYVAFQPSSLLSPSVKQLTGLLILTLSITFYLSTARQIAQTGFEIPDTLIDNTLKLIPQSAPTAQLPQITPDQLETLKENPNLLKQYGIDPKTLDNLPTAIQPTFPAGSKLNPTTEMIKPLVKQQLQTIIKPYQNIIPLVLALLLFLTLQSFVSVLAIFLPPVIWLVFLILERTNFTHFETEMREVKKLVV